MFKNILMSSLLATSILANDSSQNITLKEYILNLQKQLIELKNGTKSSELPLYLNKIHVELSVYAQEIAGVGIVFSVLNIDSEKKHRYSQRVSFDLTTTDQENIPVAYNIFKQGTTYSGFQGMVAKAPNNSKQFLIYDNNKTKLLDEYITCEKPDKFGGKF
jgi:hypothetical protein